MRHGGEGAATRDRCTQALRTYTHLMAPEAHAGLAAARLAKPPRVQVLCVRVAACRARRGTAWHGVRRWVVERVGTGIGRRVGLTVCAWMRACVRGAAGPTNVA